MVPGKALCCQAPSMSVLYLTQGRKKQAVATLKSHVPCDCIHLGCPGEMSSFLETGFFFQLDLKTRGFALWQFVNHRERRTLEVGAPALSDLLPFQELRLPESCGSQVPSQSMTALCSVWGPSCHRLHTELLLTQTLLLPESL